MPATLKPRDRALLIGAGLVLAVLTALGLLTNPAKESFPSYSSYSAEEGGTKAAVLLLGEMGYPATRWERPFADLAEQPANTLLILADPHVPPSKLGLQEEKDAIAAFLARGGRVLATGPGAAAFLPGAIVPPTPSAPNNEERFKLPAVLPSRLTVRAPQIELERQEVWISRDDKETIHYADEDDNAAVVSYPVGKGEAIWWADTWPMTNAGLARASNMRLLLNCAGDSGTPILWDEHLRGERQSLQQYLNRTPAVWLGAQFLLVFLATLVTFSRRHGPVEALRPDSSRLSPLEFVETLGDLYRRKKAAPEALEIAWNRFRFLLARRLGLPGESKAETLAAAVEARWSWQDGAFLDMLRQCERAVNVHDISEKDALRLIAEMHVCRERWL